LHLLTFYTYEEIIHINFISLLTFSILSKRYCWRTNQRIKRSYRVDYHFQRQGSGDSFPFRERDRECCL